MLRGAAFLLALGVAHAFTPTSLVNRALRTARAGDEQPLTVTHGSPEPDVWPRWSDASDTTIGAKARSQSVLDRKETALPPAASTGLAPVTASEVRAAQALWASSIKKISKAYLDKGDFVGAAGEAAGALYAYGHSNVLFKPTKAREVTFRPTAEQAMSYFVGGEAVENGIAEDGGFAINGGKGWKSCVYKNHKITVMGDVALAMGTYDFTCATTGDISTVEYTFGYQRCADDAVRIFLHHSSVPYGA